METIVAATKWGSEIMRMPQEIGTVEPDKYADLLVVDGNPLEDITLFQDRSRVQLVLKGGVVMCNRLGLPQVLAADYSIEEHLDRVRRTEGYNPSSSTDGARVRGTTDRAEEYAKLLART